jgi:hypothetical protein
MLGLLLLCPKNDDCANEAQMYITKVLSHLGAWMKFEDENSVEFRDLDKAINSLSPVNMKKNRERGRSGQKYVPKDLESALKRYLTTLDWNVNKRIYFKYDNKLRYSEIDAIKGNIGVEYILGKFPYAESTLFVKFPIFIQAQQFQIGIAILPCESLAKQMPSGVAKFEMISDRARMLRPSPLKYPFVILGMSNKASSIMVEELTSELDLFLVDRLGLSLLEMQLQAEKPNYDFKRELPRDNDKIARLICAFANLPSGGIMLIGVEDSGNIHGIPRSKLDEIESRVHQIGRDSCNPVPEMDPKAFDDPSSSERCVLAIQISGITGRPCMTKEKVYVRAGSTVRVANPDEIRQIVLRND